MRKLGKIKKENEMGINELKVGEVLEIAKMFSGKPEKEHLLAEVGDKVFIRTITHHYTGQVVKANPVFLELKDAAWIADDGRFNNLLVTGKANEVEPFVKNVKLPVGAILDVTEWSFKLPREVV